ncbi:MAG: TATA-box-binding protein [Candidatus Thermoplasmatota archaeon]|nr:TATA-box-binding protein [Candidatus Thermoplasmatota archaeon]MBS3790719.1 TATA-box-binding protein [Candidatus Thermoplasmatota archaeon]
MQDSKIKIENVVASSSLGEELDLEKVNRALDRSEYDPDKFPGLIYKLEEPNTSLLLFSSGKVVCTGGVTVEEPQRSVEKVKRLLNENGIDTTDEVKAEIQNIVASYDLENEFNLNSLAITLGLERVEYEPEQFPGLVYRFKDSPVVLLLFGSGRMVCTGSKSEEQLKGGVEKIEDELDKAGLLS